MPVNEVCRVHQDIEFIVLNSVHESMRAVVSRDADESGKPLRFGLHQGGIYAPPAEDMRGIHFIMAQAMDKYQVGVVCLKLAEIPF